MGMRMERSLSYERIPKRFQMVSKFTEDRPVTTKLLDLYVSSLNTGLTVVR